MNNNFRRVLSASMYYANQNAKMTLKDKEGIDKTWTGTGNYPKGAGLIDLNNSYSYWTTSNSTYQTVINGTNNSYGMGIYIGTGTTPVTDNDIWLEAPLSNIGFINRAVNPSDAFQNQVSYTLQNNNAEAVTVTEVAWLAAMFNPTLSEINYYLLHRELLPSPVTMEPNDIYTFTITLDTANV